MPPTSSNAEIIKAVQDLQQRMVRIEAQQDELDDRLHRLQQTSDAQQSEVKTSYATKSDVTLQFENTRLLIEATNIKLENVSSKLGALETNIVSEVKNISKEQKEERQARDKEQNAFLWRIVGAQWAVFLAILAALIGYIIPHFLHP